MTAKKTLSLVLAFVFVIGAFPAAALSAFADPPESMAIVPGSIEGYPGDWFYPSVEFYPDGSDWEDVTWSSSDESVVTVDYYGDVLLVGAGEANIIAESSGGLSASCAVTVNAYPAISLGGTVEIPFGNNYETIYYSFVPEGDGWYHLSSAGNQGYGAALYSSQKNYIEGCAWDNTYCDYTIDCQLTAGVTYLFGFDTGYSGNDTYTASLEKLVAPESISLDTESYEGYPTEKFNINVSYSPDNAFKDKITWTSTEPSVASVSSSGYVTLLSPGEAVIEATSDGGLDAECAVTVKNVPALVLEETVNVTIDKEDDWAYFVFTPSEDMVVGFESFADGIDTYGELFNSWGSSVYSSSSGGDDENFRFTAELDKDNVYYFRAGLNRYYDEYPVSFDVSAYRMLPAESLSFAEGVSGEGRILDTIKLTPVFSPEHSIREYIDWSSDKPDVADVGWGGYVYLYKVGEATITAASSETGHTATYRITVKDLDTFASGETKTVTLKPSGTVNYRFVAPEKGTYVVKAPISDYYASCEVRDENGYYVGTTKYFSEYEFWYEFKADAGEEFTISVYTGSYSGFDIDVTVEKLPAAEAIVLPESLSVEFGDNFNIDFSFDPEGCAAENITWSSSNESVVEPEGDGWFNALSDGTATITAVSENGLSSSCAVTVTMPPVLSEGVPLSVTAENDDNPVFMFMPSETGYYSFAGRNFSSENSVYLRVMTVEGYNIDYSYGGTLTVYLTEGEWYKVSLSLREHAEDAVTFDLNAAKTVNAEKILITDEYSGEMYVGNAFSLTAEAVPWNARLSGITWSSSDEDVATVTYYGYVSLCGVGTAVITATDQDGVSGNYVVTVLENPPIESISLSDSSIEGIVGDPSVTLYTYESPSNHREETITWSSSDPAVATVDQNGTVGFVGEGTAVITATSESGASASCDVTVKSAIFLTEDVPARVTIVDNVNETVRFIPSESGTYCFGISNGSNRNKVEMYLYGKNGWCLASARAKVLTYELEADVTYSLSVDFYTWYNGDNSGSFDVTVSRAVEPASVTISEGDFKAGYVGSEYTFTAELGPWNSLPAEIVWTVGDPSVASVDEYGTVTFISGGETTLTASAGTGVSATLTLRSVERPTATGIVITRKVIGTVGGTRTLSIGTVPEDAKPEKITWTSSDPSVVTVTDGELTFIAEGVATVTATSERGLSASCAVTVIEPIELTLNEVTTVGIIENNSPEVLFTPTVSGAYKFRAFNPTGDGVKATVDLSLNGGDSFVYGENGIVGGYLDAGVTYVLNVRFSSYFDSGTGTLSVTVSGEVAPESVSVTPALINGYVGESFKLEPVFDPWNAWEDSVSWSSSDKTKVTVDEYGNVKLLSVGDAVITLLTSEGLTASVTITAADPQPIMLDEVKTAEITVPYGKACFVFTPDKDGLYAFTSTSDSDTFGCIKNSDGSEIKSDDDGGEGFNFRVKAELKAGTTYVLEAEFLSSGVTGSFDVTVTGAKAAEELLVVSPPDRTEYVAGYTSSLELDGLAVKVLWSDGTSDVWTYGESDSVCGESVRISTTSSSSTGYFTVSCDGKTVKVPLDLIEDPVESIEIAKGSELCYFENAYGKFVKFTDPVTLETREVFSYAERTPTDAVIRVIYKDGSEKTVNVGSRLDGYYVSWRTDQDEEPWELGENATTVSYLGHETTLTVSVLPNPVESMELISGEIVPLVENVDGYYDSNYDSVVDETVWYFRYSYVANNVRVRIRFKDGTEKEASLYQSVNGYSVSASDDQVNNPWTIGGENPVFVTYLGHSVTLHATVTQNPVAGLELISAPTRVYFLGDEEFMWRNSWGEGTFEPDDYSGFSFKATFKDGTSKIYTYEDFENSAIDGHRFTLTADYPTEPDDAFPVRFSWMGFTLDYTVGVIESPVASIEVTKLPDNPNYADFYIPWYAGMVFRLTKTDGTVKNVTVTENNSSYGYDDDIGTYFRVVSGGEEISIVRVGHEQFEARTAGKKCAIKGLVNTDKRDVTKLDLVRFSKDTSGLTAVVTYEDGTTETVSEYNAIARYSGMGMTIVYLKTSKGVLTYSLDEGVDGNLFLWAFGWELMIDPSGTLTYFFTYPGNVLYINGFIGSGTVANIPLSLFDTRIGAIREGAFANRTDLTEIRFEGTRAQWIEIVGSTDIGIGGSVRVVCSDDETPHVHSYTDTVTPPTCTEQGYTTHTCSCGASYVDTYVSALGHDFGEWSVTTSPSCTEKGTETRVCKRCSAVETRDVPAAGHDYVDTVTPPTCTEQGYTTHVCRVCGDTYVDTYVRAAGHNWGPWTVVTPATETEEGTERRVCLTDPAHYEERPIPVTAHVHSTEEIKGSDATCTTDGSITYYVCTGCGRYFSDPEGNTEINIEDTVITAYGHNFGEWATAVPATCTASGTEERVCSRCGEKETRNIGATGHNYKESVTAPTCTEQGFTTHTCSKCGDSYVDTYTAALGHDFGSDGKAATCSRCGAKNPHAPAITFKDVPSDAFYAIPVAWAVATGVTSGTSPTTFSPDQGCTRGQVVTFLWRAAGTPEPTNKNNPFRDVNSGDYYYKAVLWAVEMGITAGTSKNTFSPNATCTRGQIVTFLWRAESEPAPKSTTNPFSDVGTGDYYYKAVLWAVEKEITLGTDKTHFSPFGTCTRGQVVTFLYRDMG